MFVHETSRVWDDLNTTTVNGKRHYIVGDAKLPSITTVLSANPEKIAALAKWRKNVGQEKAKQISRVASSRGTKAHLICERYVNNEEHYAEGAMPDALTMFKSLKPTLDKNLGLVHAQEVALHSRVLGVAGRVDLIAEWDGSLASIDYKTSGKLKRKEWISDYFMQGAAYACMYYELTGIPIRDVVIAIMVDGMREPQIFKEKVGDWLQPLKSAINYYNAINSRQQIV